MRFEPHRFSRTGPLDVVVPGIHYNEEVIISQKLGTVRFHYYESASRGIQDGWQRWIALFDRYLGEEVADVT